MKNILLIMLFITSAIFAEAQRIGIGNRIAKGGIFSKNRAYYVSNSGNDNNTGLSPSSPLKTISKVNTLDLSGDVRKVYFKRGDAWREQLTVPSSGTAGNPIVFGAYEFNP